MVGRRNVRRPVDPEVDEEDSRLGVQVEAPGGTDVVRSTAGSPLWLRCGPGTTADAAKAGLSVKSSLKNTNDTFIHQVTVKVNTDLHSN